MRTTRISARATWPLRQLVLRPGRPVEDCDFPHDHDATTIHLGAWSGDALVGIATIHVEACAALPAAKPFRLRGMAVHPDRQGQGVGALLVHEALEAVRAEGSDLLWCNARTSASGFYSGLGFAVEGEAFELPGIGPHHLMHRRP